MKIKEVLEVTHTIEEKLKGKEKLEKTKADITTDEVEIRIVIPPKTEVPFVVDAKELKKLLDKEIAKQDTTAEEADLKNKVK